MARKKKLLIADDEVNIRLMVRRTFESEYEVLEAKNGEEAVELAIRYRPRVILMDILMPKSDGLTALNKLRSNKRASRIPVIMFTGIDHELNEEHARSLGAIEYLRKPVSPQELLDAVRKIA